ncbi:MAG TPA: M28 family peptidase [Anaerolineales bacterium]|nr:M28 family peptidase [Anaerolineales bacterium]
MARRVTFFLSLLLVALLITPVSPADSQAGLPDDLTAPDPLVQFMIDQIDPGRIYRLTGDLSGEWQATIGGQPYTIQTRNSFSGKPVQKAARYLFEFYKDLDLDVAYDEFDFYNRVLSNVVAEKPGSLYPERVYLITSHYDSAPGGDLAPGADDNASGTVAVMLAAEILSRYDFACTLRFVNFAGEEQGLVGSQAYAEQVYNAGEDLRGILNLDMIAWNKPGSQPAMELHTHSGIPGTLSLAMLFQQVVSAYDLDLDPQIITIGTDRSDHASFWTYDYSAILAIEDFEDFNPYYHSIYDQLDYLDDPAYYTNMVKASLATLAHMGCLVDPGWGALSGQVTDQLTGLPVSNAVVSLHNPEAGYTRTSLSDQTGRFRISLPAAIHEVSADATGYSPAKSQEIAILKDQELEIELQLLPAIEHLTFIPLSRNTLPILPGTR